MSQLLNKLIIRLPAATRQSLLTTACYHPSSNLPRMPMYAYILKNTLQVLREAQPPDWTYRVLLDDVVIETGVGPISHPLESRL